MSSAFIHKVLPESVWQEAAAFHADRLRPVLDPYLEKRGRGIKDPVMDFLFEYYRFRPVRLLRWSPGFGTALQGAADVFLKDPAFSRFPEGVALDPGHFPVHRKRSVQWIREVLAATAVHPPFFGCYGLHEWAMVYRIDEVRHAQLALRLSPDAIAQVVEERPLVCSHYDAFRFFTPPARPLNRHQPTHDTVTTLEQPACLHANMDLYRWSYKLAPWIPGDLLGEAFLLACRIREVDMRASPYDLRDQGLEPIAIETPEGKRTYQAYQQAFFEEATLLRARLLEVYDALLQHI